MLDEDELLDVDVLEDELDVEVLVEDERLSVL